MGRPPKSKPPEGLDENTLNTQPEPHASVTVEPFTEAVSPVKWSTKRPEVGGWYYYREPLVAIMALRVEMLSGVPFAVLSPNNKMSVLSLKGEWWGPLPEPTL